ncbi:MAG: alpha/beta hydrolase [Acutalibacteraceae bacterium]
MKKNRKVLKVFLCVFAVIVIAVGTLTAVSHLYFHRSVAATVSAAYIRAVDRNAMFTDADVCRQVMAEREVTNLQNVSLPEGFKGQCAVESTRDFGMQLLTFTPEEKQQGRVIVYFHGGAYVNPPTKEQFAFADELAARSGVQLIMAVYPKATNVTCLESSAAVLELYRALKEQDIEEIDFVGDSSGGGFALSLAQQIRDSGEKGPDKLILICPWVDVTMSNPDMEQYLSADVMLGIPGLKLIGEIWAGELSTEDPRVSPFYGNMDSLGDVTLFVGTREIFYPDIMLLYDKLTESGNDCRLCVGQGMNHVYPMYPIPEADEAMETILERISQ